jgi:hypothetical protein
MRTRKLIILNMALACCFILASCSFQRGRVYRDWSANMSEMGIFPVYPPREDITVGDVYALPIHPYDSATVGYIGGLGTAGVHVEYLGDPNQHWDNLLKILADYYQSRPYPADTPNGLVLDTNAPMPFIPIASYADSVRNNAFSGGSVARLRQVAFPDFSVTTIDQSSLSAVIPIEAIMTSFSFSRSDIRAVHFKLPQAESYGVTTETLLKQIYDATNFIQTADGKIYLRGDREAVLSVGGAQMTYNMFRDILHTLETDPTRRFPRNIRIHMAKTATEMKDKIYLALISEVYFTRSIDITIERKTATGASAAARPVSASELQQLKDMGLTKLTTRTNFSSATTNTTSATSTNAETHTNAQVIQLSEGDTAYDLANKLRDTKTTDGVSDIGGSVKVLHVSATGIGLRRTFARPVVVGVRGVLLKVDINHPIVFAGDTNHVPWMRVESSGTIATTIPLSKLGD